MLKLHLTGWRRLLLLVIPELCYATVQGDDSIPCTILWNWMHFTAGQFF